MTERELTRITSVLLVATALLMVGVLCVAAEPGSPSPGHGEKRSALDVKLPKPLFQGTPKNIKPSATLEKYSEQSRPPLYVPEGTTNVALRKPVTSSDMQPIIGELAMVTDGDKEGSDGSVLELGPGLQWVQIDLQTQFEICAIALWHYHAEGRVYHDVIIQVSDDPDCVANVRPVFNNDFDNSAGLGLGKHLEYIDDFRGKLVDVRSADGRPVQGRYVRLYSKSNTSNDLNHYIEVEVYGKAAP
jgi:hypothetical protein